MSKKVFRLSLLLVLVIPLLSGCTMPWKSQTPSSPVGGNTADEAATATDNISASSTSQLKKFNSYDELARFLAENNNPESGLTRGSAGSGIMTDMFAVKALAPAVSQSSALSNSSEASVASDSGTPNNSLDYSQTNNQVAGVDEADIIKTDGRYIYALAKNELSIIKADPADSASVVSKITFKSRPQEIFIKDNFLAVFGSDTQIYDQIVYQSFRRQNPYAFFKVFDISDPANPKQVRDLDFEGSYYDARLIGDYVYFLTNTYGNYVANEPLVPRVLDKGHALSLKCDSSVKCFTPEVFYFDIPYDSYNFTNITAINIKDNSEALGGQIYLLNNGQNLYVSQNNIYITYTQYLSEYDLEQEVRRALIYPKLSAADQDRITKIEAVDSFILNNNEKKIKIAQIIERYFSALGSSEQSVLQTAIDDGLKQKLAEKAKDLEKTIIHKIAMSGNKLEYRAMGEVSGQVLNQFSLDENGDYFRLATTRNRTWSRLSAQAADSYSNIYVLDANLKTVGSLENLATTEKIYAARFIGNRVYLVTFKQTDPLFVISLSDPAKPTVLGSLKIPGFSNYLHPADKDGNKLFGLGRATEETANGGVNIKGLKLSLFDFTDLLKPKELDSYIIGDAASDSIALYDHKAFLYSAAKNILAIPVVLRESGQLNFAGAMVFAVNNDRLELKERIDHSAGGHFGQSDYWDGFNYYDNTVKRSLYIGDNLITFSNKFLKINSLKDWKEIKNLELTSGGDDYIITPAPELRISTSTVDSLATSTATTTIPAADTSAATSTATSTAPAE